MAVSGFLFLPPTIRCLYSRSSRQNSGHMVEQPLRASLCKTGLHAVGNIQAANSQ